MIAFITGLWLYGATLPGFGEIVLGGIAGRVQLDGEAATERGEGLPGVEVHLMWCGKLIRKVSTGAGGHYSFLELPPGIYGIKVIPPSDKYFTSILNGVWPKPLVVRPSRLTSGVDFALKSAIVSDGLDVPIRGAELIAGGTTLPEDNALHASRLNTIERLPSGDISGLGKSNTVRRWFLRSMGSITVPVQNRALVRPH